MKTKFSFILACILFRTILTFAQTNVNGLISTNTTWTLSGSPYFVTGNIDIDQGVTLTIQPGVHIKFSGSYYLYVDGTINAQGTVNDSIFFTSNLTSPKVGDWVEIKFRPSSTNNMMNYCHIEHAQKAIEIDNYSSTIANTFTVSNSLIQNNKIGVYSYFDNGGAVSNNKVRNNQIGISSYSTVKFDIIGNTIISNGTGMGDEIWGIFVCSGKIKNNIISNNNGYGVYWHSGSNSTFCEFTGNTIDGNAKDGIYLLAYPVDITNPFENNTIINNKGSGINFANVGTANISKNEIAGNGVGILNNKTVHTQNFSIIQNCIYINGYNFKHLNTTNIDLKNNWWGTTDSIIISSKIYDFFEDFNVGRVYFSPLIKDKFSYCNSSLTDIAQQEFPPHKAFYLFPNPFNQSAILQFENIKNETYTLKIIDCEGRQVLTKNNITTDRVEVERNNLASGLYFFQLQTDKEIRAIGKLLIE